MIRKITGFMREYILCLSVITAIIGIILLFIGVIWFWFREIIADNNFLDFIGEIENWNAYLLVAGLLIFGIGLYYLYSYLNNRKFALEELKTDKRSEFLKKHNEIKGIVKRLPSKYHKMLKDKEDELNIR